MVAAVLAAPVNAQTDGGEIHSLADGSIEKYIELDGIEPSTEYLKIHKDALVTNASLDLSGEGYIDESFYAMYGYHNFGYFDALGQQFTVNTDLITGIEIALYRWIDTDYGPVTLHLRETVDGPDLSSATLTWEHFPVYYSPGAFYDPDYTLFDISDVSVTPGNTYVWVLTHDASPTPYTDYYFIGGHQLNGYPYDSYFMKESWNPGWYVDDHVNDWYFRIRSYAPTNPTMDVGADGDVDWTYSGSFQITETVIVADELNQYIFTHQSEADAEGNILVPLEFFSDTVGLMEISNINIYWIEGALGINEYIQDLPAECFKNDNENLKNAFNGKLNDLFNKIEAGDYDGAIDKIENDIWDKVDKWIDDPDIQQDLFDMLTELLDWLYDQI